MDVGDRMKIGDLVRCTPNVHGDENRVGIITHLWVGGSASVLYEDGEYDVDSDDLEVISESRWGRCTVSD